MANEYKNVGIDDFKDFEPWICGTPCEVLDIFKVSGASSIKLQHQPYSFETLVTAVNYKISGQPIYGTLKGSAPKVCGHNNDGFNGHKLYEIYNTRSESYDAKTTVSIYKSGNDIYVDDKKLAIEPSICSVTPSKIGVILVGGGGGAGGWTWYDACKNGKDSDQYVCGGSGGGGGGIVWGVINLEKSSSSKRFWITLGGGGSQGSNASRSGLTHNDPKRGGNGSNGGDTTLGFGATAAKSRTGWTGGDDPEGALAIAYGGGGGASGYWTGGVSGGGGGSCGWVENNSGRESFYQVGAKQGGAGASALQDSDTYVSAYDLAFAFLTDETGGSLTHTIHHDQINTKRTSDESVRTGGGHSYGTGADITKSTTEDCYSQKGGGGGDHSNATVRSGAKGYWALFY